MSKVPDKVYLDFIEDYDIHMITLSYENNGGVEYIRKDALLKILTDLRDDAGVRDDQYEKDAILEYNLYDELIKKINEM